MTPLLSAPLLRAQTDRRLAGLARDGHDRAFEAIVERYRRPLHRYLRRLLSEPLAEDVLQATFVRAWQALRTGTEVQDLRAWLYRIAHNQAVNALRIAGAALPHVPGVPAVNPEDEVERREELRATLDEIDALPERQRAAILAVAVADRPHSDVAAELGLSDGALRQLLLRARTTLRGAATAVTPYPIVAWLAGGQEVTAARVGEVAAGAGGAGLTLKAGAAVLAAGAVVAGAPGLRDEHVAPVATHEESSSAPAHRRQAEPAQREAPAKPAVTHAVTTTARATPKPVAHSVPVARHVSTRHGGGSSSSGPGPAKHDEAEPEPQHEPEHEGSGPSGHEQVQPTAPSVSDHSGPSGSDDVGARVESQSSSGGEGPGGGEEPGGGGSDGGGSDGGSDGHGGD
jgi:RNA polymerase sigma factor (sigma-70 family)